MSDLGLLSHQYQTIAALAKRLRRNILRIKRLHYELPLRKGDTESDVNVSLAEMLVIIEFLHDVIPLTEEDPWPTKWIDNPPLPNALVKQLRKRHELDNPLYVQSLTKLVQRLQQDTTFPALRDKDILLLEEIAQSANADANTVFRKLMRWA